MSRDLLAEEIVSLIHDELELTTPEELSARINKASEPFRMSVRGGLDPDRPGNVLYHVRKVRVTVELYE